MFYLGILLAIVAFGGLIYISVHSLPKDADIMQ